MFLLGFGVGQTQQRHDERHADVDAILHLLKVSGAGVVVHVQRDLIHTGQGMQHGHVFFGQRHLVAGQNVAVLQADVVFFVEEALLLHTGHIKDVELRHGVLQAAGLAVGDAVGFQHILDDIIGHTQLFRADEHEADVFAAGHGLDEGVDGAAELQIAAQADGQIVQTAHPGADGHQVGHGLGGVLVAAVARVDDRDAGVAAGAQGRTFFRVAHGHDVGVAGDHADGVGNAFALGGTGNVLTRKTQHMAAQVQHGRLKGEAGAGGRLVEQGGELFVGRDVLVSSRVAADAVSQVQQGSNLFRAEIQGVDQMAHGFLPPSK